MECRAKRVIKKDECRDGPVEPVLHWPVFESEDSNETLSLTLPANKAPLIRAKPWRDVKPLKSVDSDVVLLSIDLNPKKENFAPAVQKNLVEAVAMTTKPFDNENRDKISSVPIGLEKPRADNLPIVILAPTPKEPPNETKNWSQRLADANADKQELTRFLAFCLFLIAIVNVIPLISHFQSQWSMETTTPLPRWIYFQFLAGLIFLIYLAFLLQMPNGSALRGVLIAMLIVAFVFGSVSTALLMADNDWTATVLGIPVTLSQSATTWCAIVACLTTLISFWAGKNSINWQRAERMLHETKESTEQ